MNGNETNIETPSFYFLLSKKGLQSLLSIFDRYYSWLWDYIINTQDIVLC